MYLKGNRVHLSSIWLASIAICFIGHSSAVQITVSPTTVAPGSTITATLEPDKGDPFSPVTLNVVTSLLGLVNGVQPINNVNVPSTVTIDIPQVALGTYLITVTGGVTGEESNNLDRSNLFTVVDNLLGPGGILPILPGSGGKGSNSKTTNSPTASSSLPGKDPSHPNDPGNNPGTGHTSKQSPTTSTSKTAVDTTFTNKNTLTTSPIKASSVSTAKSFMTSSHTTKHNNTSPSPPKKGNDNGKSPHTSTHAQTSALPTTISGSKNGGPENNNPGGGKTDHNTPTKTLPPSPSLTTVINPPQDPDKGPNTPSPTSTNDGKGNGNPNNHHSGDTTSAPAPSTPSLSAANTDTIFNHNGPNRINTSDAGDPVVSTPTPGNGSATPSNNPPSHATETRQKQGSDSAPTATIINSISAVTSQPAITRSLININNVGGTSSAHVSGSHTSTGTRSSPLFDGKKVFVTSVPSTTFSDERTTTFTSAGTTFVRTVVPVGTVTSGSWINTLYKTVGPGIIPTTTSRGDLDRKQSSTLKPAVIAAIVIGAIVLLVIIALLSCICIRRRNITRRRRKRPYMFAHEYSPVSSQFVGSSSNPFSKYSLPLSRSESIVSDSRSTLPPYPASERSSIVSTEKNLVEYGNEPERMKDLNIQRSRMQELIDAMRMRPESQEVWEAI